MVSIAATHPLTLVPALLAGVVAGAINSVAGGGSFISFPTLLFLGIPPIIANATNNFAMWAGTIGSVRGYREELAGSYRRLLPALGTALAGGVIGSLVLLHTPDAVFARLIPWLLLGATAIFAGSDALRRVSGSRDHAGILAPATLGPLFVVAVYGGYFGAGVGILVLALLALSGVRDLIKASGVKSLLALVINGVACVPFVLAGKVDWAAAGVLAVGAAVGAYGSARVTRRVSPKAVRVAAIGIGVVLSAYFFLKR